MPHPSIKHNFGNMVTHSKTCITGKWTETWVFNLSRETKTDRKTHRWTTKSLWPHVLASPISDAQHFASTANVTLRNLGLGPWLEGRGARFLLSCLLGFSYLFLNPWSPFFFFNRNYLYDDSLWNSVCLEPSKAVIWHVSFFSMLLCISLLQILLVVIHFFNSFLSLFCSLCDKW